MAEVGEKILMLCSEFQSQLYIAIMTVTVLVNGVGLMIGGETAQKTKKNLAGFVIGAIIVAGAVTLGANYGAKLRF